MTILGERTGGGGRHGTRMPRRERLRRSVRRAMRGRNAKWALAALSAVAVLIIGLLFQGYLGSPARTISSDPSNSSAAGFDPTPKVTAKPKLKAGAVKGTGAVSGGLYGQLKAAFPDNPLNHLRGPGLHQVSVEVTSTQPIKIVGYLVPTGLSSPYATVHPNARSYTLSQQALGGGYLAAVFVQSDQQGAPITCRVVVDGKVTNTETAHGSYGRAVCLG